MREDLRIAGLESPGDVEAAGPCHRLQQFLVDEVDAAIARPGDAKLRLDDQFTQPHDLSAIHREQIRVHVDMPNAEGHERADFLHQLLRRSQAHRRTIADVFDAVGAACRTTTTRDDERVRSLDERDPVAVERQLRVVGDRQIVQIRDERPLAVHDDLVAVPPGESSDRVQIRNAPLVTFEGDRSVRRVVFREQRLDIGGPGELVSLEMIDEVAQRQIRFATQPEVERGVRPERFSRQRRDMRAERNGARADSLGHEGAVHVVAQCRRRELRHVILRPQIAHDRLERLPGHPQRDGIDDLDRVGRLKKGGKLRERDLRPDHVFA